MVAQQDFPSSVVADAEVTLRLANDSDAETISNWTRSPEVHSFWAGRPVPVEEVLAKYTGRRAPEVVSYVISEGRRPVGYVQAWQQGGRFGLDMFIAAEAQGRGIGPRAARALAQALAARGWTPLTVDPALDNVRAIGAWRAAGFASTGELGSDEGKTTQVMAFGGTSVMPDSSEH
jgi:aminoglycoside 6'-N-acetyltransferase